MLMGKENTWMGSSVFLTLTYPFSVTESPFTATSEMAFFSFVSTDTKRLPSEKLQQWL